MFTCLQCLQFPRITENVNIVICSSTGQLHQEWMATLDARTRLEHGMADGQKVDVDKPFIVGGEKLMFPADPNGSAWNTYNCRCTTVADLLDFPDAKPRETYSKWLEKKSLYSEPEDNIIYTKLLTKVREDGSVIDPMNSEQYYRIKAAIERQGYEVHAMSSEDEIKYMFLCAAEAMTDETGIMHLGEVPSASAMFEEMIHLTQMREYGICELGDNAERYAREVAANRKLLKSGEAYGFKESDFEDITRNLKYWEKMFKKEMGISYDESGIVR